MGKKWKTPIRCPECSSTAVRRREVVHKSGTSIYSGRSSTRGLSFALTGNSRPRGWFGGGSNSGKRQSIRAEEAEPMPFWPAIVIPILIFLFRGENGLYGLWSWLGFAFSGLWFLGAVADFFAYQDQWLCSKCGAAFIPASAETEKESVTESLDAKEITEVIQNNSTTEESGKDCSICGKRYPYSEYQYGNRENRSYCQQCNAEERAAYSQGGTEAARRYREDMRSKWKTA